MDFVVLNGIPFLAALLIALPVVRKNVPKAIITWGSALTMLALFIALLTYFPQVSIPEGMQGSHAADYTSNAGYEAGASGEATQAAAPVEAFADEPAEAADEDEVQPETVEPGVVTRSIPWVPEIGLTLSFYLDGLSLLFALIVTGVGAGIFLYAGYYFEEKADQTRFIATMWAFAGAMLGLVLSGNLVTLFIMWELTSITSFLLIGFKGDKYEAARFGAQQAFMVTGVGALALIGGIGLLAALSGDVLGTGGLVFDIQQILNADSSAVAAHPLYIATVILLGLGAFTKSAQFPFHFWLPGAMSAPTPASAYLHSATMVKAGVYLLLRFSPPLHNSLFWTQMLVIVGISTMFIAAVIAVFQRDLKGLLAYSTISWLGALVGMIGLPDQVGIEAAIVGIIAHALYKAALFLSAGTIDHNFGTRIIDELGGIWRRMPLIFAVVLVSALSMAGVPVFFGFVAKEVLLHDWLEMTFFGARLWYVLICISAALTGTAGYILIWDVFIRKPDHKLHYHASPLAMAITPAVLALGTVTFGFFLDGPVLFVENIVAAAVREPLNLHLLPDTLTDPTFLTSMGIVVAGFIVFLGRSSWIAAMQAIPLPKATDLYQQTIRGVDAVGTFLLRLQNGQLRYYLVVILGTVATTILFSGIIPDLAAGQRIISENDISNASVALRFILLVLAVISAFFSVIVRKHITAILAVGIFGYAVGGIFLIEHAPDVSLVQFLMETLGTILMAVMVGRISSKERRDVMAKLWQGRSQFDDINLGIIRDVLIAVAAGVSVFFFTITALVNRPDRTSVATYYLENTAEDVGIVDIVGAIVTDYRGMDTVIEVTVFAVAALSVLSLLTRGYQRTNPFIPTPSSVKKQHEFDQEVLDELPDVTSLNTPFTRIVSNIVLPLSLLVALSHLLTGTHAPGDGFTAGAIAGLVTGLWYVVFGYDDAHERLPLFAPHRLIRIGLAVVVTNGFLPVIFGLQGGYFLAHVDYGKLFGISELLHRFGLELTSGLFFEIGIAITVLGGISSIIESVAHPTRIVNIGDTDLYDRPLPSTEQTGEPNA